MREFVLVVGSLAAVVCVVSGARVVLRRDAMWAQESLGQFGLTVMMILLVMSNVLRSAAIDLIGVMWALVIIVYGIYWWRVRKRLDATHSRIVSGADADAPAP